MGDMKLYQDCTWPVRLWRRRHYLPIPFRAVKTWVSCRDTKVSLRNCFDIAVGLAQYNMNWVYLQEDIKNSLDEDTAELSDE